MLSKRTSGYSLITAGSEETTFILIYFVPTLPGIDNEDDISPPKPHSLSKSKHTIEKHVTT